jgi:polyhydroxyalkanoate synthesis regulator phasin
MSNIIRIKRRFSGAAGAPSTHNAGELAYNGVDDKLYLGTGSTNLIVGGAGHFATKTELAAETSARQSAITAETSAREAADLVLDGKIATEKGRVDAILDASEADKDSFAEIVALINSVDTENDSAFAGYVTSNNAALAQEVSDRQAGDSTLQSNIDSEASTRASADTTLQGNIDSEATTRSNNDATLQSNIDSEASTRAAAVTSLEGDISSLEGRVQTLEDASADARLDEVESDIEAIESAATTLAGRVTTNEGDIDSVENRVLALETEIDGGSF